MSIDLSALLQDKVGSVLNNYAATQLGESPTVAGRAVSLVLPALVGAMASKTTDHARMTELFNLITGPQVDSTVAQVTPSLIDRGRNLLGMLFGSTGVDGIADLLARKSSISSGNATNLLAAAFPLVLGALRSHVQTNNMTQPQFVHLLSGQRGFLERVLDGDFFRVLGLGALGAAAAPHVQPVVEPVRPVATPVVTEPAPTGSGWMKWLWLALAAIAALLLLKFCNSEKPAEVPAAPASTATVPVAPASVATPVVEPASVASSAPAMEASAPATVVIVPKASDAASAAVVGNADTVKYENNLLTFYFATGKSTVNKGAADAVSADTVAAGKGGKKLVVSGFNDPRGNAAANAELSKNRAKAVKTYLMDQGVPEANIELRKPADTNGSDPTLAEDRRVDVKVE